MLTGPPYGRARPRRPAGSGRAAARRRAFPKRSPHAGPGPRRRVRIVAESKASQGPNRRPHPARLTTVSATHPQHPGSPALPPPTPAAGILTAPRGRRRDHLLVTVVGLILAPAMPALAGLSSESALTGHLLLALLDLVLLAVVAIGAQSLFGTRSSLGGVVAGMTALVMQIVILLSSDGAAVVPFPWARALIPTGMTLIEVGVLVGGAWGMRMARRAGRAEARGAARLATDDARIGVTPAAPPSRRRDHIASLLIMLSAVAFALGALQCGYAELVRGEGPANAFVLLAVPVLLGLGTVFTGRSTLGARVVGPLLALAGLPAFASWTFPGLPGRGLFDRMLPDDPTAITFVATGVLLTSIGWGVHLARREGRTSELAALRAGVFDSTL